MCYPSIRDDQRWSFINTKGRFTHQRKDIFTRKKHQTHNGPCSLVYPFWQTQIPRLEKSSLVKIWSNSLFIDDNFDRKLINQHIVLAYKLIHHSRDYSIHSWSFIILKSVYIDLAIESSNPEIADRSTSPRSPCCVSAPSPFEDVRRCDSSHYIKESRWITWSYHIISI